MERTSLFTRIIALSLTVICITSVASLAQIASSATSKNEADYSNAVNLQYESIAANQLPSTFCIR